MFRFYRKDVNGNKIMVVNVITENSNWTPSVKEIKTEKFPVLGENTKQIVVTHTLGETISITGQVLRDYFFYLKVFEHDYCYFEDPDGEHYVYLSELVRNQDDETDYYLIGAVMEVV